MTALLDQATRIRKLGGLIPLWPNELEPTLTARATLIGTLRQILKAERARGLANSFAYDLPRHRALMREFHRERTEFALLLVAALAQRESARQATAIAA